MNEEKTAARQAACAAERARELAAAGGASGELQPTAAERPGPGQPLDALPGYAIPQAIEALAAIGGSLSMQHYELAMQLDEVLKALESLRGQAIPTEALIALGLRLEAPAPPELPPAESEATANLAEGFAGEMDGPAAPPAADPPPETD